jgi:hypothetical protein
LLPHNVPKTHRILDTGSGTVGQAW